MLKAVANCIVSIVSISSLSIMQHLFFCLYYCCTVLLTYNESVFPWSSQNIMAVMVFQSIYMLPMPSCIQPQADNSAVLFLVMCTLKNLMTCNYLPKSLWIYLRLCSSQSQELLLQPFSLLQIHDFALCICVFNTRSIVILLVYIVEVKHSNIHIAIGMLTVASASLASSYLAVKSHQWVYFCSPIQWNEPLFYDCTENEKFMVLKEGWSIIRGLFWYKCTHLCF